MIFVEDLYFNLKVKNVKKLVILCSTSVENFQFWCHAIPLISNIKEN